MYNFWKKHKIKFIAAVAMVAMLVGAFCIGGDSPGSYSPSVDKGNVQTSHAVRNGEQSESKAETHGTADHQRPDNSKGDAESAQSGTVTDKVKSAEDKTADDLKQAADSKPEETAKFEAPEQSDPTPLPTPIPTPTPIPEPETKKLTCTISISCSTILNNMDSLEAGKEGLGPSGGYLLGSTAVTFTEGESVYDVLRRVTQENGIHMEASFTPIYHSVYIEGIGNLYEFDCGSLSGWMYSVNGWFPNYGCSSYILADGDVVSWVYTCDLGADVGGAGVVQG